MRCFSAIAVVSLGSGMSSRRSGMDVVKRIVTRRGAGGSSSEDLREDAIWIVLEYIKLIALSSMRR
jgi:hypothetical protein